MEKPRDKKGRILPHSELDEKPVSARLRKGYSDRLKKMAEECELTPTELARSVIEDYLDGELKYDD